MALTPGKSQRLYSYEYSLISGYNDGSFLPDNSITREEAMTIIAREMEISGVDTQISQADIDAQFGKFQDQAALIEELPGR